MGVRSFVRGHRLGFVAGLAVLAATSARPEPSPDPLMIHGNKTTFEIAPVLLAAERTGAVVKMGGIPNLVGEAAVPGFGEPGVADLATHAETQALRYSVKHPELRIVLTVTEGLYRLVARRSAGVARPVDLRGKRIATVPTTSSGFFLARLLAREGLTYQDVTVVTMPLPDMAKALAEKRVDAVTIWEPEVENAARAIGTDAIEFGGKGVYRELFDLNTTAANLADPAERARIVAFVRATIRAAADIRRDPTRARELVSQASGHTPEVVARSWAHHDFVATLPHDLLDVLVEEEVWLAGQDKRQPRSRTTLATLIDRSVLAEALGEKPAR